MPRLLATALQLRRDPRVLKLPPYLSLVLIVVGVTWLLLLPFDHYSRRTYISENALLPGQVHTYFSGSDQNVFRAYRSEADEVADRSNYEINDKLENILDSIGLKVARQNYTYHSSGHLYTGQNIYAILQAPRGDATEAIVLIAAWRNMEQMLNRHGVSLALTLARYFKRWSLWSKDIIFLFPPDSKTGTQAWVDAYHDSHDQFWVNSLPIKAGALQGAIAIDYPQDTRFKAVHVVYDGVNGQLPNLDLINSIVHIAGGQMGFGATLQGMWQHTDTYRDRLQTIIRGMLTQGLGCATGPHSSFIPYHVDAVTLQPYGEGWQDEMAMGRLIEGSFRSLNNLLEHLHQSFFFYLLMSKDRFVSIGTYLPSAMLLAANFTIMATYLWVKSGQCSRSTTGPRPSHVKEKSAQHAAPTVSTERELFLPLCLVLGCHSVGVVPLYIFNHAPAALLSYGLIALSVASCVLPHILSWFLRHYCNPSPRHYLLAKCFSLLLLGMFLSSLATLNFPLAFFIGLLASPMSFTVPSPRGSSLRLATACLLNALAPTTILYIAAYLIGIDTDSFLLQAAFSWNIWGNYTPFVIWCVWWPVWLVGSVVVLGASADPVGASASLDT